MNKKLFASFMIPMLLISVVPSIYFGYRQPAQVDNGQAVALDNLLEVFARTNSTVNGAFLVVEARGETIPVEARENYSQGLIAAAEAIRLRNESKFEEAKDKILEAMRYMRMAMLSISSLLDEVETPEEDEAVKAAGIDEAITRINSTVKRLEDLAEKAEASGLNATKIREKLSLVIAHLISTRDRIKAGDVSGAATEMNQSRQILGQAMSELNALKVIHKINQTKRFLNMTEKRLTKMAEDLSKMIDRLPITGWMRNQAKDRIKGGLQIGKNRIAAIHALLEEGRLNEAIERLQDLRSDLASIVSEAESHKPNISRTLDDLFKLDTSLAMYEDIARGLSQRGINTSEVMSKIQEAQQLASEVIEAIKDGNIDSAKDLYNQAVDAVKDIKALIVDLKEKSD